MLIDLGSTDAVRRPASTFRGWRASGDAHRSERPRGWALIGHGAVSEAFRDADTLSADRISVLERAAAAKPEAFGDVVDLLRGWMIFRDPPGHTQLREPVRTAFTTRRANDLVPLIDEIVEQAVDDMVATAVEGAGDVTRLVARPVPARVIGALLGIPEQNRDRLQAWSDQLAAIVFSLDPSSTPTDSVVAAADAFTSFFGALVDDPPDEHGLIARIAATTSTLTRIELVGLCTLLLFAGHETTTSLLQQIAAVLLEDPALADRLRMDDSLVESAVEEFMRCYGPARTMVRKARSTHDRAGVTIQAGDTVLLSIAGANNDDRVFAQPAEFDPSRDPNPHLGFGWGLHHCLGAQLARQEAASFTRIVLRRFPDLRPAGPVPVLSGSVMGYGRGPISLAVQ